MTDLEIKTFWEMKLDDKLRPESQNYWILRVHKGWIYIIGGGGEVFVPDTRESKYNN